MVWGVSTDCSTDNLSVDRWCLLLHEKEGK